MRLLLLATLPVSLAAGGTNVLTPEERASGWHLLFDGKSFEGWIDPAALEPPGNSWLIEDGCLVANREPRILEGLATAGRFRDFDLRFEFEVERGGNSGIKYRVWDTIFMIHERPGWETGRRAQRHQVKPDERAQAYTVALEFQLIDDERHPDALRGPDRRTGALYRFVAPSQSAAAPAGQWHSGRLVVSGSRVEHWIDGVRLLDANLEEPALHARIRDYWSRVPGGWDHYVERSRNPSPIVLQNHGDSRVRFRNLKIRTF